VTQKAVAVIVETLTNNVKIQEPRSLDVPRKLEEKVGVDTGKTTLENALSPFLEHSEWVDALTGQGKL
jgi:hypothetical protein